MTRLPALTALLGIALISSSVFALGNSGQSVTDDEAKRAGLKIAWQSHLVVDPYTAGFSDMYQYVGPNTFVIKYELKYADYTQVISEMDSDENGYPIGVAVANQRAKRRMEQLKRLSFDVEMKRVEQPVPSEIRLYAVNSSGITQCVDGKTGRTLWKTLVGRRNRPTWVSANERYVVVINGIDVFCLDTAKGKKIWTRQCNGAPSSKPIVSDRHAFVAMSSGRIQMFPLNPKRPNSQIISPGNITTELLSTPNSICWVNNLGQLNFVDKNGFQDGIKFRLETDAKFVSTPAFLFGKAVGKKGNPHKIFVGDTKGDLFCMNESGSKVHWEFPAGVAIQSSPIAFGGKVYVNSDDDSLYQIDAETGIPDWQLRGMKNVISASKTRVYAVTNTGRLLILNKENGSRIASLATERMTYKFSNHQTDRIFIGNKDGSFQCLHEVANVAPLLHIPVATRKAGAELKDEVIDRGDMPAKEATDTPKKTDDPFGDDPFGAGGGGAGGAGGGGGDAGGDIDDPFGGL